MITVCTCSHSVEVHALEIGRCSVCTCSCFRGAKRMPKSCRYPLRNRFNSPNDFTPPPSAFAIPCGPGVTMPLSAAELGLFEEQEKAS